MRKKSLQNSEVEHNHFDNGCCRLNDRLGAKIHDYGCLIHRTIDFTVPIVQQVIEDYVKNMSGDTVYWQSQSDGTAKGEFAYGYTELSTLVMKPYYRLLDALEDEALAYIETKQVARNWMRSTSIAEVEVCTRNTIHRNQISLQRCTLGLSTRTIWNDQSSNGRD